MDKRKNTKAKKAVLRNSRARVMCRRPDNANPIQPDNGTLTAFDYGNDANSLFSAMLTNESSMPLDEATMFELHKKMLTPDPDHTAQTYGVYNGGPTLDVNRPQGIAAAAAPPSAAQYANYKDFVAPGNNAQNPAMPEGGQYFLEPTAWLDFDNIEPPNEAFGPGYFDKGNHH